MFRWTAQYLAALFFLLSGSAAWGARDLPISVKEAQKNLEIDRIDLIGVTHFPGSSFEKLVEVSLDEPFNRQKIVRTEENLLYFYRSKGYQEVKVQTRLVRKKTQTGSLETALEFDITEGRPVRVGKIELAPLAGLSPSAQVAFERTRSDLEVGVLLRAGDILDQELLLDAKRHIQEILVSEDFVGGGVADIIFTTAPPPAEFPTVDSLPSTPGSSSLGHLTENVSQGVSPKGGAADVLKWLNVSIVVDMGEKVSFGYRGNQVFSWGYLSSLVSEQRLLRLGKDYISTIKARIEDEYRAIGYAQVSITPYTFEASEDSSFTQKKGWGRSPFRSFQTHFDGSQRNFQSKAFSAGYSPEERRVTFEINEGPRVRINSIDFDGNTVFSSDELRKAFFSKASGVVQNWFYVEKDIQKATELLVEHMKERGYLSARLITVNSIYNPKVRADPGKSSVNLMIYLYEGEQTLVRSIQVKGTEAFSQERIIELLRIEKDRPLNLYTFAEGIEALKRAYRDEGYLEASILNEGKAELVQYFQENRFADIAMEISEGVQSVVTRVEIEGLGKTKDYIVERELFFKEGQILRQSDIHQTEQALRRLGIFANINIRVTEDLSQPHLKAVRVVVKEADRGILSYGPGYRNDLGIRGFGQLAYTNLWGMNHTVALTLSANRRFDLYNFGEAQVQVAYSWPHFLMPGLTFRPVITGGRTQFINFSADTLTVSTNWDKQFFSYPNLTGYFGYTFESVNQFAAAKPEDNRQMTIGSITPKLTLDLRDNPLVPKSGFFATTWVDLSMPLLGSQALPFPIAYYRVQFRGDYYLPLGRDIIWYLSFRTGYEQSTTQTRDPNDPNADPNQDAIPLIKQFAMGGIGSMRGYREQELNFQQTSIRGSLSYVNYRTQMELPFAGALRFAVFLDAANLLADSYSLTNLRYGTGFGFHYETLVGPVSLDWGFKLDPPPGTDAYVIHFSVGVI